MLNPKKRFLQTPSKALLNRWELMQQGHFYYLENKFYESFQCYEKVLKEIDPKEKLAWIGIGLMHEALGNMKEALLCYEYALTIDPQSIDIYYRLTFYYTRTTDLHLALDFSDLVICKISDDKKELKLEMLLVKIEVLKKIAISNMQNIEKESKFNEALAICSEILNRYKRNDAAILLTWDILIGLENLLPMKEKSKKYQNALDWCEKYIDKCDPTTNLELRLKKVIILVVRGVIDEADMFLRGITFDDFSISSSNMNLFLKEKKNIEAIIRNIRSPEIIFDADGTCEKIYREYDDINIKDSYKISYQTIEPNSDTFKVISKKIVELTPEKLEKRITIPKRLPPEQSTNYDDNTQTTSLVNELF